MPSCAPRTYRVDGTSPTAPNGSFFTIETGSDFPIGPRFGKEKQAAQKRSLLTMEFRTFVNSLIRVPAQILRTGGRLVIRLLAWNEWQPVFLKLAGRLSQPLRC